jgi:hypothetical protein
VGLVASQNLIRSVRTERLPFDAPPRTPPSVLFRPYVDSPIFCTDTLIAPFNSLMSLKISLLFKINSLFRILGNFGKKHW